MLSYACNIDFSLQSGCVLNIYYTCIYILHIYIYIIVNILRMISMINMINTIAYPVFSWLLVLSVHPPWDEVWPPFHSSSPIRRVLLIVIEKISTHTSLWVKTPLESIHTKNCAWAGNRTRATESNGHLPNHSAIMIDKRWSWTLVQVQSFCRPV